MSRRRRTFLLILATLLLLLLVGPFLVPVRPLTETQPARDLAGPDSRFLTIPWDGLAAGLELHYRQAGAGEPTFVLLHGFAANLYSWDDVFDFFAAQGTVYAYDRIPFGLSSRPVRGDWTGPNPYPPTAAREQLLAFLNELAIEKPILVGNSAGGALAASFALTYPDRVEALILVDAAIYTSGGTPAFLKPLFNTPQMNHLGPLVARAFAGSDALFESAFHELNAAAEESKQKAALTTQVDDWDYAFWEFTAASEPVELSERLAELTLPSLVITGDDDRIVPTEESIRLAGELPDADLAIIAACGHIPHDECPEQFMAEVANWLAAR
jgi:pimeloyl-ACP methyl ester carboxylesterase